MRSKSEIIVLGHLYRDMAAIELEHPHHPEFERDQLVPTRVWATFRRERRESKSERRARKQMRNGRRALPSIPTLEQNVERRVTNRKNNG